MELIDGAVHRRCVAFAKTVDDEAFAGTCRTIAQRGGTDWRVLCVAERTMLVCLDSGLLSFAEGLERHAAHSFGDALESV